MTDTEDTKTEIKLTAEIPLPKKNYVLRCIEEEQKQSGKGNLMIVRVWEIVDPADVPFNGNTLVLAGTKLTQYLTFKCFTTDEEGKEVVDKKKSASMSERLKEDFQKLGFKGPIDYDNPIGSFRAKDMLADWVCGPQEYTLCEDLTEEQRAKGDKQGTPILSRNSGKHMTGFKANLIKLDGASSFKPLAF